MSDIHSCAGRVYEVYHKMTGEVRLLTLTDKMLKKRIPDHTPGPMALKDMACSSDLWSFSDYTQLRTRRLKSAEQLKGQATE